jgi:hypothetical protein
MSVLCSAKSAKSAPDTLALSRHLSKPPLAQNGHRPRRAEPHFTKRLTVMVNISCYR